MVFGQYHLSLDIPSQLHSQYKLRLLSMSIGQRYMALQAEWDRYNRSLQDIVHIYQCQSSNLQYIIIEYTSLNFDNNYMNISKCFK